LISVGFVLIENVVFLQRYFIRICEIAASKILTQGSSRLVAHSSPEQVI